MKRTGADDIGEGGELFATHIGGAATIEGVMMRGRLSWAVAVRCPDGDIYVEEHDLAPACDRPAWTRLPIVRGAIGRRRRASGRSWPRWRSSNSFPASAGL